MKMPRLRSCVLVALVLAVPAALVVQNRIDATRTQVERESAEAWVGKVAKAFTLPGIDGKPVDVGKQFGKRPVVLIFYRGVW